MAAKKSVEPQENGAKDTDNQVFRVVTLADDEETVLKLNMVPEVNLDWDYMAFKKLPDKIVHELRPDNLRRYILAEAKAKERASKARVLVNPFNPIQGNAEARERIRPRKGWHQAWKNPGREYEEAMLGPYKPVRVPTEEQKKNGCEPGEENGEILKRKDAKGDVEAIAVECPEDLYQDYLAWMDQKSSQAYSGLKDNYFNAIEDINRTVTRRGARIIPMELETED